MLAVSVTNGSTLFLAVIPRKILFLQLMMLGIVDVAMIAGLENDIVKSNIERVLFVLQKHVTFLFKRTSAYDCRVDCTCEKVV